MIIDALIGLSLIIVAWSYGFGWNSLWMILAVFVLDFDIPLNEFWRIFIKKEKKFQLTTLLDEYSYTHKFWFHLPLIVLPLTLLVGYYYQGWLFGILLAIAVFLHLVRDTVDNNFDGIMWLWPFNDKSYKLRSSEIKKLSIKGYSSYWEIKTKYQLSQEADLLAKKSRTTAQILRDNK